MRETRADLSTRDNLRLLIFHLHPRPSRLKEKRDETRCYLFSFFLEMHAVRTVSTERVAAIFDGETRRKERKKREKKKNERKERGRKQKGMVYTGPKKSHLSCRDVDMDVNGQRRRVACALNLHRLHGVSVEEGPLRGPSLFSHKEFSLAGNDSRLTSSTLRHAILLRPPLSRSLYLPLTVAMARFGVNVNVNINTHVALGSRDARVSTTRTT